MPPPYYPLYRDWDVYLTRVRFCSLATRSSFVSRVELLQHAPGITSRMFPACDVSQNALTLTDPSSALNSFKGPALEVTPALPSSVPPQHQSTLQNEQIQFFYHVLRYQRAMHRPAILEASGIRHQASVSIIWYQALSHQPIVGRRWRAHFRPTILGFGYWIRASQSQRQGGLRSRRHGAFVPYLS